MNYNLMSLLFVVVTLFYSTTLVNIVNGNCPEDCVPHSCKDWYNLGVRKSCYYPIYPDGMTHQLVYCDMKGAHCDGKGGWTRIGYLNMSEPSATCPPGLTNINYSGPVCGRTTSGPGCSSVNYSTLGIKYFKVCGRIRGYEISSVDAFAQLGNYKTIDTPYVDGISITHGQNPRQHIWTYGAGHDYNPVRCPCATPSTNDNPPPPSFVGNHYYCEGGNDILWDGKNCPGSQAPCCNNTKQPWFYRVLDDITQDGIELRVCADQTGENIPLDIIELYVC